MFAQIRNSPWGDASISSFPTQALLRCALLLIFLLACSSLVASAESVPDDFEWKVPTPVLDNEFDQLVNGVYKDIESETVYTVLLNYDPFTGEPDPEEYVVINRFNTTTREFDLSFSWNYSNYRNRNEYIVHGERWYVFHVSDGVLHMRINNSTTDTMEWVYDYSGYQLIGVYDGVLFFIIFKGEYGHTVELFSVNITTYAWAREVIFQLQQGLGPSWDPKMHHIFKNGTLYLARSRIVELQLPDYKEYKEIWLYEYDTVSGLSKPRRMMWTSDNASFGRWDFEIDRNGDFHLLLGRSVWRLIRLAPSMELEDWVDLEVNPGETRSTYGSLFINLDGPDTIQVLGTLWHNSTGSRVVMSWTLDLSYGSSIARKTIFEGRSNTYMYGETWMMCFSDGEIIACIRTLIDDKYVIAYTCKIPPSPDLSISPGGFRLLEQQGTGEPVVITIRVSNIGKAVAEQYMISLYTRPSGEAVFGRVGRIDCNESLPTGSGRSHEIALGLPPGGMTIRVLVHEVVPFENYVDNNAYEVYVFINVNIPPALSIIGPENGTVVDDVLTIEGRTEDMDTGDELVNIIEGLPDRTFQVPGEGNWNFKIDLDDVLSGDYLLSIRAYDGNDYSRTIFRSIRVDHPEETLILSSYAPNDDPSLLVGEYAEFTVAVRDHFSRNVEYSWFIDGEKEGLSTPFYLFQSQVPGTFILRVEATNHRSTVTHGWDLTVREPIAPTIVSRSPDEKVIRVALAQPVVFSFNIINPDGLDISIVWRRGEVELPQRDITNYTLSFGSKGIWTVSAILHSTRADWIESWTVIVENSPPRIILMDPEPSIIITEGDVVSFSVEASDPDGDILSYDWTAFNYAVYSVNTSALQIEFKEIDKREIILILEVSDGADHNSTRWTIVIEQNTETDDDSNLTLSISIVTAAVLISSFVFFYMKKTKIRHE